MPVPINCKTMLGHGGLDFSITCLKSFIQNSEQIIHLQIFEDGSLTIDDKQQLLDQLPNSIIVDKTDRNIKITQALKNHPGCLAYRNSIIFGQKLFDIMLHDTDNVLYIDCDILFLKKFRLPELGQDPVFMSDTFNAYSFQPKEFLRIQLPVVPHINAGFLYFPKKLYDLNFIEQLLNNSIIKKGFTRYLVWSEQTIWAFLAAKAKTFYYFDNDQIMMAQQVMKIPVADNLTQDSIAIHLVGSLRGHVFPQLKELKLTNNDIQKYTEVRLNPSKGYLSKSSFFIDRLRKKWRQMRPNNKYAQYRANWTIK